MTSSTGRAPIPSNRGFKFPILTWAEVVQTPESLGAERAPHCLDVKRNEPIPGFSKKELPLLSRGAEVGSPAALDRAEILRM